MRTAALLVLLPLAACSLVACGNGQDPKAPSDEVDDVDPQHTSTSGSGGPGVDSEIGALDEKAVNEVFRSVRAKVTQCLRSANDGLDLPVVGGDLELQLRVKGDGTVRWVYPMRSTLGDRKAEQCVLSILAGQAWPKPEGGDEGLAKTDYGIDPPGRAPVQWSPGDLGGKESGVKSALKSCKSDAGATSLSVTMYVDADGKVITAGGSVGDENGVEAIDCGVDAVKGMKFPSPGSYPAKVTVTVN